MKTASMGQVKSQFSAFVKACETGPIIVTRNGKPVAVLVGVEEENEIERVLMANSPRLQAIIAKSRQSIREGRGMSHDEFWRQFGKDPNARRRVKSKAKRGKRKTKAA
ncbi:MAG TPA: type II toxin-antitoxin system Phd/YefM family antitoxin [Pirellulales bacterium]|nr:type II toxin-antitoxin system Phd/YefM family antitoxin [Pirellulales bacterium]